MNSGTSGLATLFLPAHGQMYGWNGSFATYLARRYGRNIRGYTAYKIKLILIAGGYLGAIPGGYLQS